MCACDRCMLCDRGGAGWEYFFGTVNYGRNGKEIGGGVGEKRSRRIGSEMGWISGDHIRSPIFLLAGWIVLFLHMLDGERKVGAVEMME